MRQKSLEGANDTRCDIGLEIRKFWKLDKASLAGRGPVGGHWRRGRAGGSPVQKPLPDLFANQERDEERQQQVRGSGYTGCCHAGNQLSTGLHQDSQQMINIVRWHQQGRDLFILLRNNNNSPSTLRYFTFLILEILFQSFLLNWNKVRKQPSSVLTSSWSCKSKYWTLTQV